MPSTMRPFMQPYGSGFGWSRSRSWLPRLRRRRHASRCLASGCVFLLLASGAAAQQSGPRDPIAALSKKVLADPLDAEATRRLAELRQQQSKARNGALLSLETGLEAYLAGRPDVAAPALRKAADASDVAAMAKRLLPVPLDELIRKCEKGAGRATAVAAGGVCLHCGGTGWADCPACQGCGVRLCPDCRGTGKVARWGEVAAYPKCKRTGALPCEQCKGRGGVSCGKCAKITAAAVREGTGGLGAEEARAARKAVAMARYLRSGGIDCESPDALKRAPKMTD